MRPTSKAVPALKRRRRSVEKPEIPPVLRKAADRAITRHQKRVAQPGVSVDVEKNSEASYVLTSPHNDRDAWEAMICDALGTRSESVAITFLGQLTQLCSQNWHPAEHGNGGGEWCPGLITSTIMPVTAAARMIPSVV